jgi:hypothetical protein
MKISAGKTDLYIVISSLEKFIDSSKEYENINPSIASTKIIEGFYEKLLLSPLVFYVPNKSIVESNSDDDFKKYADDIFYMESMYTLLLCMNLSPLKQKKFEVSWIVCEMNKEVQKTRVFHDVAFLDFHMKREEGKKNTNGRLDYAKMDALFFQKYKKKDLENFLKIPRKFFFSAIYKITTAEKKGNYAKQELQYIDNPNSIKITDKQKKLKHNYHCSICDTEYLVYLNGNKEGKANVKNHIKLNGRYIEFLCNHDATEYSGIVRFSFDAERFNFILQTDEQYNQAFLYLFHKCAFNDGEIMYYKNKDVIAEISVDEFHKKRLKNA